MKNFVPFILLFSLVINTNTQAQTKNEKAVANAAEKLRLAMISGNQKELESIITKKLTYGYPGGYIEDKKEFIEKLVSKKSDFVGISIDDQVVSVTGKTAIVRHILSAETNDNNKPGRIKLKVMLVFVKQNGQWKLAARQALKPI